MSNSKFVKSMLVFAIVAVMCIGGSLAYLSVVTNERTNVFTFQTDISATLDEPNWDPDNALNLIPGAAVAKDPRITNDSNMDEYVALKLTFTKGDGTVLTDAEMTRLMTLITIQNGTGAAAAEGYSASWSLINTAESGKPEQSWYYNNLLASMDVTTPIFDSVVISDTIANDDFTWLRDTLGGFNIQVIGAAVQASAFEDVDGAANDLYTLLHPTP